MLKIVGVAFATIICSILLKDKNRPFAIIISIVGGCVLLTIITGEMARLVSGIIGFADSFNSSVPYIRLMLKVLAISLATQFISDVCRDNGENAMASVTEFSSKILVVAMIMPLFESIFMIVNGLVK